MSMPLQALFGGLDAAVRVTERLSALPAVAAPDWRDLAAECLAELHPRARVCLMICTVDEAGSVVGHEAVGVAVPDEGDHAARQSADLTIRSRAERLMSIGFRPTDAAYRRGVVAPVARLTEGSDWRSGPLGPLWSGLGAADVLIGLVGLGEQDPGRVLFIQVGLPEPERVSGWQVGLLRAVLPLLQRRTLLAVGVRRSNASRWLTAREQQVLEHLTLGRSVRQIAESIDRSPHTVHDHVKSLHRKLEANSRGQLVARALGHLDEQMAAPIEAAATTPEDVLFLLADAAAEAAVKPQGKKAVPLAPAAGAGSSPEPQPPSEHPGEPSVIVARGVTDNTVGRTV